MSSPSRRERMYKAAEAVLHETVETALVKDNKNPEDLLAVVVLSDDPVWGALVQTIVHAAGKEPLPPGESLLVTAVIQGPIREALLNNLDGVRREIERPLCELAVHTIVLDMNGYTLYRTELVGNQPGGKA
jgi:hypothetical protein